jgi:hypothetical protein
MKKAIYRLIVLAIVVAAGWQGYKYFKGGPQRQEQIATAKVQRGDVVIRAFTRGELKSVRTFPIYAPNLNGTVQVTQLAPMGAFANEKDLIVEYDDSELLAAIDADKLALETADENIRSRKLDMQISSSSDKVSLLSAEYGVRRAELAVKKNDVSDAITAKGNLLSLESAKRSLEQTKNEIEMRVAQQQSSLQVAQSSRTRALSQLRLDEQRLRDTRTLTPIAGMVAIKQNRAGSFNFGQQMPDIRSGDMLQAGMNVADILDLSEMELSAKVGELDRANLSEGQSIYIQLDSIPDKRFPGKIKVLSGTAATDVFSGDPSKKFDVTFSVDMRSVLAGLGMTPAEVDRVMKMSEENAKKNLISFAPTMQGGRGGRGGDMGGMMFMGGGGMMGMMGMGGGPDDLAAMAAMRQAEAANAAAGAGGRGQRGEGGPSAQGAQGGQRGEGGPGRMQFGGANLSDEDRQKMTDLRQKMRDASPEDREKLQAQLTELMAKAGIQGRGGFGGRGGEGQATGGRSGFGGRGGEGQVAGGRGDFAGIQGRGGQPGGRGAAGAPGAPGAAPGGRAAGPAQFTDDDRKNAQLPKPPEEGSQQALLLRPGLLADVEVIIEHYKDALHVPSQAVFLKEGKPTVFVREADGRWVSRGVEVLKKSESTMVLGSGVQAGEIVALSDPTVRTKKGAAAEQKKGSGTGMPMPGAK